MIINHIVKKYRFNSLSSKKFYILSLRINIRNIEYFLGFTFCKALKRYITVIKLFKDNNILNRAALGGLVI